MKKRPGTFDGVVIDEYQDVDRAIKSAQDFGRRYPIEIMLSIPRDHRRRKFMISVPKTETAAVSLRVLKPRK